MRLRNHYFLLRHGQTNYQKIGLFYPWPDSSKVCLTRKGRTDIARVAKNLKKVKIDLIFSSDLFRTKQTAGIITHTLGLKVIFDMRLRDINFGVYHGQPKEIFNHDFPLSRLMARFKERPKGGENWNEARQRVKSFLTEIEKRHQGKNILIVGHGGPLLLLEGLMKSWSNQCLVNIVLAQKQIKVGELREI